MSGTREREVLVLLLLLPYVRAGAGVSLYRGRLRHTLHSYLALVLPCTVCVRTKHNLCAGSVRVRSHRQIGVQGHPQMACWLRYSMSHCIHTSKITAAVVSGRAVDSGSFQWWRTAAALGYGTCGPGLFFTDQVRYVTTVP